MLVRVLDPGFDTVILVLFIWYNLTIWTLGEIEILQRFPSIWRLRAIIYGSHIWYNNKNFVYGKKHTFWQKNINIVRDENKKKSCFVFIMVRVKSLKKYMFLLDSEFVSSIEPTVTVVTMLAHFNI